MKRSQEKRGKIEAFGAILAFLHREAEKSENKPTPS
jgi:hypothetical protein